MSFSAEDFRNDFVAPGGSADFNFSFPIYNEDDITVLLNGTVQVKGTEYTVRSGAGLFTALPDTSLPATGFIRFVSAPASNDEVALISAQPFQQTSEYTLEAFPPVRLERDFDKLVMIGRTLREVMRRTLQLAIRSTKTIQLDDPVANRFLRYSSDGTKVVPAELSAVTGVTTPVSPAEGGTGSVVGGVARGDLLTGRTGGTFDQLAVGSNDTIPQADSTQTPGIVWRTLGAALFKMLTAKGDLAVGTGATVQRRGVGADGTVLTADAAQADGVKWANAGGLKSVQVFTITNTYTKPAGVSAILVEMVGGGGGGGGCATAITNSAAAGGGSGGSYARKLITNPSATHAVTVGAKGTGGAAGANNGGNGTESSFDALCIAKGGLGGTADTVAVGPRVGGNGALNGLSGDVGDVHMIGTTGSPGMVLAAAQAISGAGGASGNGFGGGARGVRTTTAGGAPTTDSWGAGGSGACILSGGASQAGGDGHVGIVVVWEYA